MAADAQPRDPAKMPLNRFDLGLAATMVCLLFAPVGAPDVRPLGLMLLGAMILYPALRRHPGIWIGLTLIAGWRVISNWPLPDNHAYLLAYWCGAISLALLGREEDADQVLSSNARLLIGLTFLLAVIQKAVSPDYLDTSFFRFILIWDDRFEDFSLLFSSITEEQIDAMRGCWSSLLADDPRTCPGGRSASESIGTLAWISTWGNFIDQALAAICFLAPQRSFIGRHRDIVLIAFCFVTYAVAPVTSFGWLLLAMGLAQSTHHRSVRLGYIAAIGALLVYDSLDIFEVTLNFVS
jgi:hypothetical protein